MRGPKDEQSQDQEENNGMKPVEDAAVRGNWNSHQQIDEEGNEITPDEIK
ncbi:hypothetical protein [Pedobacter sp.]